MRGLPLSEKCQHSQENESFDGDQLEALLGNTSLALEAVLLCVTYSLGQDSGAQKWVGDLILEVDPQTCLIFQHRV